MVEAARAEALRLVETDDALAALPLVREELARREKQRIHFE
jgi:hypothetical protein